MQYHLQIIFVPTIYTVTISIILISLLVVEYVFENVGIWVIVFQLGPRLVLLLVDLMTFKQKGIGRFICCQTIICSSLTHSPQLTVRVLKGDVVLHVVVLRYRVQVQLHVRESTLTRCALLLTQLEQLIAKVRLFWIDWLPLIVGNHSCCVLWGSSRNADFNLRCCKVFRIS